MIDKKYMPQYKPNTDITAVISLRMNDLRKRYGNKYKNQLEWATEPNHVNIGRGNILRIKVNEKYLPFPNQSSPFANPYTVAQHGREKALSLYETYIRQRLTDEPELYQSVRLLVQTRSVSWRYTG